MEFPYFLSLFDSDRDVETAVVEWAPDATHIAHGVWPSCKGRADASGQALGGGVDVRCLKTGRRVLHLPLPACAAFLAWSPNGQYLVAETFRREIRVWRLVTDSRMLSCLDPAAIHFFDISAAASFVRYSNPICWSPDSRNFMFCTMNQDTHEYQMHKWDVQQQTSLAMCSSDFPVASIIWSPSSTMIAMRDWERQKITVWCLKSNTSIFQKEVETENVEGNEIKNVIWSRDSTQLIIATLNCVQWVNVGKTSKNKERRIALPTTTATPDFIVIINDGAQLLTASCSGRVYLWRITSNKETHCTNTFDFGRFILDVRLSSCNSRVAFALDRVLSGQLILPINNKNTKSIAVWTIAEWSDRSHHLFQSPMIKRYIFCLMCVRHTQHQRATREIAILPIELWLMIFQFLIVSMD